MFVPFYASAHPRHAMSTHSTAIGHLSRHIPNHVRCPKCATRDFIRFEHVINGRNASKWYVCGACQHEWVVLPEEPPGTQRAASPLLKEKPDRRDIRHRDALTRRLHSEFQKIPGLSFTHVEVSRLFGIAPDVCQRVLCALVEDGLLDLRTDGRYVDRPSPL